jgi:outer membrane lipoprotein-sorting protein
MPGRTRVLHGTVAHARALPLALALALVPLTPLASGGAPAPADPPGSPGAGRAPAPAGGPTLATEDTMRTDVSTVLVRAPRVTLEEILDRVARGEARRDSLMRDQSFTATLRVMRDVEGKKGPVLFAESVTKVYKKKPDKLRTIELRQYQERPEKDGDDDFESDFSPSMGEEIVTFAFRPANRKNFRFTIEDRKLLGDHLVYTLAFEPRSALAVYEPAGRVWVDTKDFVIVRQEIEFRQSPVPLFLKDIKHMVVERTRAGEFWVLSRVLVRMELTVPIPRFGRAFDFAMGLGDYTVNTDLPDSLFAGTEGRDARRDRTRVRVGTGRKRS